MVDHMSVEGGPGSLTNVKKIVLIVLGILFAILVLGTLAIVFTLERTVSCYDEDVKFFVNKIELPTVTAVSPQNVCVEQGPRKVTFTGTNFISYNKLQPTVNFGPVVPEGKLKTNTTGMSSKVDVFRQEVSSWTTLEADLSADNISAVSQPSISIMHPLPKIDDAHFTSKVPKFSESGCGVESKKLVVVPAPRFDLVSPRVMCSKSRQVIRIGGSDFVFISGTDGGSAPSPTTTTAAATTGAKNI